MGSAYTSEVYRVCMARTNIDLDEEAVAAVMARYDLKTKKEAVNFALRRAARPRLDREGLLALEGIGWGGDLDAIKHAPVETIDESAHGSEDS